MNGLFLPHENHLNQINREEATSSLLIVAALLLLSILLSLRKKERSDASFLTVDTGNTLRGVAVLFLLFGHFAIKCVEGEYFFEYAGKWAVVIFLFVSGIALSKAYGMSGLHTTFLLKRLERLAFPTWITLAGFYLLDSVLLHTPYSGREIVISFLGIITPDPPNGPAWFITYILFLYLLYFSVSRLRTRPFVKFLLLLFLCYLSALAIMRSGFLKKRFDIWVPYTVLFPLSVLIGLYREKAVSLCRKLFAHPLLYALLLFLLAFHYFSGFGVDRLSKLINSETYSTFIYTLHPVSLVMALVMVSFALDRAALGSGVLEWLGTHSFEIYLVHMPFMVYYDFLLFRKPLPLFFCVYLLFIVFLSYLLKNAAKTLNRLFFRTPYSPAPNRPLHS